MEKRTSIKPGDFVLCEECSNSSTATQSWIEHASSALKSKGKWPFEPRSSFNNILVAEIPSAAIEHLECEKCGSRSIVKQKDQFANKASTTSTGRTADVDEKYKSYCKKCKGFNGLDEYCHHCGGSGFEPITEAE